jgi:type I restriction enzyme, R subunit
MRLATPHHDAKQQAFLEFVLSKYIDEGVSELAQEKLPVLINIKYSAMTDAIEELGSPVNIKDMFIGFQQHLYKQVIAA